MLSTIILMINAVGCSIIFYLLVRSIEIYNKPNSTVFVQFICACTALFNFVLSFVLLITLAENIMRLG